MFIIARSLFFFHESLKKVDLDGEDGRKGLRGTEQGKTGIGIYYMRKEPSFNKRKKKKKNLKKN